MKNKGYYRVTIEFTFSPDEDVHQLAEDIFEVAKDIIDPNCEDDSLPCAREWIGFSEKIDDFSE